MPEAPVQPIEETRLTAAIWWLLMLVTAATPVVFSTAGYAVYLGPQKNFFQAGMLVIASLAGLAAAIGDRLAARLERHRALIIIAAAGLAWSAIVTMTAVKPVVSYEAPFTMFCYAVLFVGILAYGRSDSSLPLLALLVPSTINAAVVLLQAGRIWSPVAWMARGKGANIGFLGNPNIAGAYLIVPTVAAVAAAFAFRRWRWILVIISLLHLTAIVAVQAVSAVIAIVIALLAMAILSRSWKAGAALVLVLAIGAAVVMSYEPTRTRVFAMRQAFVEGRYVDLTSYRLPADAVALEMFLDRPLVGMGPGGFSAQYVAYRLKIDEKYPSWLEPSSRMELSFEQVHNDHLQLLSESGLPGYLLAVALAVSVARLSKRARGRSASERQVFLRWFSLPAVIGFAVVTLAQFPLQITAAASSVIYAAAICHVWSRDASD